MEELDVGLFGSRRPVYKPGDKRTSEEKLAYYVFEEDARKEEELLGLVKAVLLGRFDINSELPACDKEAQVSGILKLIDALEIFRTGIIQSGLFPSCLLRGFDLSPYQLKYVCLRAGFVSGIALAKKIKSGTLRSGYISMSNEYLQALGTDKYSEALDMIVHIHNHDPKSRVDLFLREAGLHGVSAVADLIEKTAEEGRIRKGPFKGNKVLQSIYCTIHDGYWVIRDDLDKYPKETSKSLTWLACSELRVPKELVEDLLIQMDAE